VVEYQLKIAVVDHVIRAGVLVKQILQSVTVFLHRLSVRHYTQPGNGRDASEWEHRYFSPTMPKLFNPKVSE